jgi:hypothetical protein
MLINRLQNNVFADLSALHGDDEEAKSVARRAMMTASQVKVAPGLLKKILPDLSYAQIEATTHRTLDEIIRESQQREAESDDLSVEPPSGIHH